MKLARTLLSVAAAAALGACSTTTELLTAKKIDYKSAGQLPSLEIPPDLTTPARDNRYVVPDTGKSSATLSGYQADRALQAKTWNVTSGVLPSIEKMRVERAGTQRWLVISRPADKLWEPVKDFWLENGFLLVMDQANLGIMETDWAENRAKIPQDIIRSTIG